MQLHPKKKVEIVIASIAAPQLIALAEAAGAKGHTLIPGVHGRGQRGVRQDPDIFGDAPNVMLLVVCGEDVAHRIVEAARPLLERYAGVLFVSDVMVTQDDLF